MDADPHLIGLLLTNTHIFLLAISQELTYSLILVVVLLVLSGLVSASELAFFSLKPKDIDLLKEDDSKSSKRVIELLRRSRYLLSTILISNNLINVSIVMLSYYIINNFFAGKNFTPNLGLLSISSVWIQNILNLIVVTAIILIFGEAFPKVIASHKKIPIARFMSGPLAVVKKIFYPLSYLMVRYTQRIENKLVKYTPEIDAEDISSAIDMTTNKDRTTKEIDLLKGIVNFGSISVKQIMQPRMDIHAVSTDTRFSQLLKEVVASGFSRIPVYQESLDNVVGLLHAKDLLQYLNETDEFNWNELLHEPFYVPETKKIDDLLNEMQEGRRHMALVVDEYGSISGLVTLEDIVEEVLGDIRDEFDDSPTADAKKINENTYSFEAKVPIIDACRYMGLSTEEFDEVKGDSDSLGGLIIELLGRLPEKNEVINYNHYSFKILAMERNRIKKILINLGEIIT